MKYIGKELNQIDVQENKSVKILQQKSVQNIFPNEISIEARGQATLLRKTFSGPTSISQESRLSLGLAELRASSFTKALVLTNCCYAVTLYIYLVAER